MLVPSSCSQCSLLVFAQASAVGLKVGVAGNTGVFHATGVENEGTEKHTEDATAVVGYSSIFAEVMVNDTFGFGIDWSPDEMDSETAENVQDDLKGVDDGASSQQTNTVKVSFENLAQAYITINLGENLYVKGGVVDVDIITNENLETGSTYGDTSMSGEVFGIGYDRELSNGVFVRVEGQYLDFGSTSLTATNNSDNKIDLNNLEGLSAKIALLKAF